MFAQVHGLGNTAWHKDSTTGLMCGNPSVSHQVSFYLIGICNQKACAGEVSTSTRAITSVSSIKVIMYCCLPVINHTGID